MLIKQCASVCYERCSAKLLMCRKREKAHVAHYHAARVGKHLVQACLPHATVQVSRGEDRLGLSRAADASQPTPAEPSGQPADAGEVCAPLMCAAPAFC